MPKRPFFTKKELMILKMMASEKSNKDISEKLHISENTVKAFKTSIRYKLRGTGIGLNDLKDAIPALTDANGNVKLF